jgi:ATP-dependent Lon protease
VERLPVLPLGKLVVYPHVVLPLSISDPRALQLIDDVVQGEKRLLLGVVRHADNQDPQEGPVMHAGLKDLYEVGTLGLIVRMMKLMDGTMRVMIQGVERVWLRQPEDDGTYLRAAYEPLATSGAEDPRVEPLKRNVVAQFSRVIDLAPYLAEELHEVLEGISDPGKLADFVAANLDLALPARVELLSLGDVPRRLERLAELLAQELQVLEVGSQIQEKVRAKLDEHQREYVLREQLRVIRQELGEEAGDDDVEDLVQKLDAAGLSAEARRIADRELRRLKQMSPQSAEYHVARTYLEVIAALPWERVSPDRLDLKAAREILDRDHYDLAPIKDRILEHLAVRTLNPDAHGSILCFVGPPGVGKTSLGQSIARFPGGSSMRWSAARHAIRC